MGSISAHNNPFNCHRSILGIFGQNPTKNFTVPFLMFFLKDCYEKNIIFIKGDFFTPFYIIDFSTKF